MLPGGLYALYINDQWQKKSDYSESDLNKCCKNETQDKSYSISVCAEVDNEDSDCGPKKC